MKKIFLTSVLILSSINLFAAEVSSKIRLVGDIFKYDGTAVNSSDGKASGSFSMFRVATQSKPHLTPYMTLATSTEEAGVQIKFATGGDGTTNLNCDEVFVWMKPFDMLKITAGHQDLAMNKEVIDFTSIYNDKTFGYSLNFNLDAFSANVLFGTENGDWFFQNAVAKYGTSAEPRTSHLKDLYTDFAFASDYGTFSAMFQYSGKHWDFENVEKVEEKREWRSTSAHPDGEWVTIPEVPAYQKLTGYSPDTFRIGTGYNNKIENVFFFADAMVTAKIAPTDTEMDYIKLAILDAMKDARANSSGKSYYEKEIAVSEAFKKFDVFVDDLGKQRSVVGLDVDGYMQYEKDEKTIIFYLKYGIRDFLNRDNCHELDFFYGNNNTIALKAYADYKFDNGIKLFGYFDSPNLLRKESKIDDIEKYKSYIFTATMKAGLEYKIGMVKCKTYLQLQTGANVTTGKDLGKYDKCIFSMPVQVTASF